jgi:octaprenyl-diphosphate synthase
MVADHLVDHEPQELLGKFRVQIGAGGQGAQAGDLIGLAAGVGGRQAGLCLVTAYCLGDLEAFGQHEHQGGIDIVDALAIGLQYRIGHANSPIWPHLGHPVLLRHSSAGSKAALARAVTCGKGNAVTATIHNLRRDPSIQALMNLTACGLNAVNHVILDRMQSPVALIPELAGHLIAGGGKRLRPMLTLGCASLLGYEGTRHYKLAAAVEFIHTATLLHDDVVDASGLRRGKVTANALYGNPASVLVGDFLFSRAFELMVEDGSLRVLKILSRASAVIAEGEVAQLTAARDVTTTEDRYLDIISAKTAALFAAACQISGVVAERDEKAEEALASYGRYLGIAFQLVDDAIDYVSDAETMGKNAGDDFRDGKITLPVILAYARGNEEDREFWRRAMTGRANGDAELARAGELLRTTNAVADTMARARHYGQRAIDVLGSFAKGPARDALTETVEFAIHRAY